MVLSLPYSALPPDADVNRVVNSAPMRGFIDMESTSSRDEDSQAFHGRPRRLQSNGHAPTLKDERCLRVDSFAFDVKR
jgi:hypothetical protein